MTEAELRAIEGAWRAPVCSVLAGVGGFLPVVQTLSTAGEVRIRNAGEVEPDIAKLIAEIRSLRSQLVSPSDELVNEVTRTMVRGSMLPSNRARQILSAIAKHLGLTPDKERA